MVASLKYQSPAVTADTTASVTATETAPFKTDMRISPGPFGPLLVGTIADVPAMEQAQAGNYSTTILTSLPGRNFSPGSRPLSTRNRSTARSVTAMRPASFSTVSPGATVATTRCKGLAFSVSPGLLGREVPLDLGKTPSSS